MTIERMITILHARQIAQLLEKAGAKRYQIHRALAMVFPKRIAADAPRSFIKNNLDCNLSTVCTCSH